MRLSFPGTRIVLFCCFLSFIVINSCKKSDSNNNPPVNIDFSVTNTWECTVDGINYSGDIDTSFTELYYGPAGAIDTMIYCTGTSADKKANIHFRLYVNRRSFRSDSVSTQSGNTEFDFDTTTSNYLKAKYNLGGIIYKIDGLNSTKFSGRFAGTAYAIQGGGNKIITNGKFSFNISKGNNEPKFLFCNTNNMIIRGYINDARFVSNTLVIDGLGFNADTTFQIMVRTGSSLKTGVFDSRKGEVGFKTFRPSAVLNYVSDTIGNLTVNIQNISGNIVQGTFSGISYNYLMGANDNIANGKFKCRVKNYLPQQDSVNKWGFSESNGVQFPFNTAGGNILSATRNQIGPLYYLDINGESDNGLSKFKVKLRSSTPITSGIYQTGTFPNYLDSFYFQSPLLYYEGRGVGFFCQIDTITSQRVVGRLYGGGAKSTDTIFKYF